MSRAPALLGEGRGSRFALLAAFAVGQAAAAAAAAVATRSLFVRWHDGSDPMPAVAGLAVAAAGLALLGLAARVVAEDLGQRYAAAVRRRVFAHLARSPLATVEAMRAGGLMLRFTGDLAALSGWVSRGAARLISAAIALPLGLAALAWISPAGAAGAAGPLVLGALAAGVVGNGLDRTHRTLRRRRSRLAGDMGERLRVAPLLRLIGRMGHERRRLDAASVALRAAALARARRRALVTASLTLGGAAAATGLIVGCHRAGAPASEVAGALAALALALGHGRALGVVRDRWHGAAAARSRLDALLAGPTLPRARRDAPRPGRAPLRLEAVSAGAVRDFSAVLRTGEKVALSGPAGAGKSTLLRLAAGLAAPTAGTVRAFGTDPRRLAPRTLARHVLYLGPEPALLSGSLRRALCLGLRRRPDDAALRAVAERVGLRPLLARPGGLDAPLAEGGRDLSHGERALIGLARLALAPTALALIDGLDAHLDAAGRAALAAEITARPGAALCVFRHEGPHLASLGRWTLPGPVEGAGIAASG